MEWPPTAVASALVSDPPLRVPDDGRLHVDRHLYVHRYEFKGVVALCCPPFHLGPGIYQIDDDGVNFGKIDDRRSPGDARSAGQRADY